MATYFQVQIATGTSSAFRPLRGRSDYETREQAERAANLVLGAAPFRRTARVIKITEDVVFEHNNFHRLAK